MFCGVEAGKREKRTVDLGFSMCPLTTNSLTAKDVWSEFCAAILDTGNTSSVAQNGKKKSMIKKHGAEGRACPLSLFDNVMRTG